MVRKLLHTRMRVNDLERTLRFYQDALGLTVSRRHTSPRGAQLAFLQTPAAPRKSEISPAAVEQPAGPGPAGPHAPGLEVDDLATFADGLAKKGYPLSDGPTATGSGSLIAFVDAPEGYEVELIQRAKA